MPPAPSCAIGAVTTRLTVTVPQGISGGDLVRVAAPDGSFHNIMVPGGLASGQQFSVELLATSSSSAEVQKLRVCMFSLPFTPLHTTPLIVPSHASQLELDAERALRRETQQEAMRNRSVSCNNTPRDGRSCLQTRYRLMHIPS